MVVFRLPKTYVVFQIKSYCIPVIDIYWEVLENKLSQVGATAYYNGTAACYNGTAACYTGTAACYMMD